MVRTKGGGMNGVNALHECSETRRRGECISQPYLGNENLIESRGMT